MAAIDRFRPLSVLLSTVIAACLFINAHANSFDQNFFMRGYPFYYEKSNGSLTLKMYRSGSATFRSYSAYVHGYFSVMIKLPCNDSSAVLSTYFLSSGGRNQDEVDLEFLGHVDPTKIVLHTNVFVSGKGGKQEGYRLWFNPCKEFHNYTVQWNDDNIVWFVDGTPIRIYSRVDTSGKTAVAVPYPTKPMYIYGSIWLGSAWATQGGLIKPNWAAQPWFLNYKNFDLSKTCRFFRPKHMTCNKPGRIYPWSQNLTQSGLKKIQEMRAKYMVYSYLI